MDAQHLINALASRGIDVTLDGDRLCIIGDLNDIERQSLKQHKAAVIDLLVSVGPCQCGSFTHWIDEHGARHCSGCNPHTGKNWREVICTGSRERHPATVPSVMDTDLRHLPPWQRHLVKTHNRQTFITLADGQVWEAKTEAILKHAAAADYSDLLDRRVFVAFAALLIESQQVQAHQLHSSGLVRCIDCDQAKGHDHPNMITCAKGHGSMNIPTGRWATDWIGCPDFKKPPHMATVHAHAHARATRFAQVANRDLTHAHAHARASL